MIAKCYPKVLRLAAYSASRPTELLVRARTRAGRASAALSVSDRSLLRYTSNKNNVIVNFYQSIKSMIQLTDLGVVTLNGSSRLSMLFPNSPRHVTSRRLPLLLGGGLCLCHSVSPCVSTWNWRLACRNNSFV